MRRLCLCLSFLLGALVVAPSAIAQDELKLNQTYRDVIQLSFPAGQTQIPLPEGEWELLGLQEDQSTEVTRMWLVYLARVEDDILVGKIVFWINHDLPSSGGWSSAEFCDKDNLYYIETKSNRVNDVDCWAVHRVSTRPTKRWRVGKRQMHDALLAKAVRISRNMVRASFIRRNQDNYLQISYYFHSYPPGKPAVTRESLKSWARDWKPKVDAGFLGELEVTKTKETFAPPEQTPKTVTSGEEEGDIEQRIIRLLKLYDEGLITESEYIEMRNRILEGL